MPCLLLRNRGLVKTVKFKDPSYVGDPINTIRIFNEKEVDELILLDITATPEGKEPNYELVADMAGECFMPLTYGGGVTSVEQVKRLNALGAEKVAVNSAVFSDPELITRATAAVGSQSIIAAIDVKRTMFGKYRVMHSGGRVDAKADPVEHARRAEALGAGEILLTAMDRDGTFAGYDLELTRRVSEAVGVPVIANGGAGKIADFGLAVKEAGASAVAAGSMVVYQGPHRAVLINFPRPDDLRKVLE